MNQKVPSHGREIAVLEERVEQLAKRLNFLEGAVPMEEMADVKSGVTNLGAQRMEDRREMEKLTDRLVKVEVAVYHVAAVVKWGLGVIGAVIVAVAASAIGVLVKRG